MPKVAAARRRRSPVPEAEATPVRPSGGRSLWLKGLGPLVLLAALLFVFFRFGPLGVFKQAFPPIEELTIERVTLPEPGLLRVHVVNGGPEPVTIAQVTVDDAAWTHSLDGPRLIDRLERRTITVPYPWVEGETHAVHLVTSTGLVFEAEIPVATQTPSASGRYIVTFALLGLYVGVIPVLLGLLWLPFLNAVSRKWIDFFLSLTIGLLVFLAVDAGAEALEISEQVAGAFQGLSLVLIGVVATPLLIAALGQWRKRVRQRVSPLYVSALIALAIGLHNFGEGLAIGAAYSTGAIALGTFLVLGFLLHNTTEGLGIVAPLAREKTRVRDLVLLGLLAGVPTIVGAWVGGFTYSPVWVTLFFAIGAGAILQVVVELWRLFLRREDSGLTAPLNAAGLVVGLLIMYVTGLLVTA